MERSATVVYVEIPVFVADNTHYHFGCLGSRGNRFTLGVGGNRAHVGAGWWDDMAC